MVALADVDLFGRLMAVSYGVGAALTLDEFALWLSLEPDAYWTREGRLSIDAVIIIWHCWRWARGARHFSAAAEDVAQGRLLVAQRHRPAQFAYSPRAVASSA
jgi:hypothetical protein